MSIRQETIDHKAMRYRSVLQPIVQKRTRRPINDVTQPWEYRYQ
jgi:hypothetical protein